MLLDTFKINDNIDSARIESIQPRALEGCFAEVNETGAINIYLIQDQIPEWLLAFLDNDLHLAYLRLNDIPVISLKFRHLQLTMPIYNQVPTINRLTLCSLDHPQMRINKINRYTLPKAMFETLQKDIEHLADRTPAAVYSKFDALDENESNFTVFEQGLQDTLQIDVL